MQQQKPEVFWEHAGDISYAEAMFANSEVEKHVNRRLWQIGIDIGKQLGLNEQSNVLDLGCGDGELANMFLGKHFRSVHGIDLSSTAIKRAQRLAPHSNMHFEISDITKMDFSQLPQYDGAYLWGILHHVKSATPSILQGLRPIVKRIIVLEPNGNNLVRKLLEKTAQYKMAGEDSFRTKEMEHLFQQAGYRVMVWKRLNLFPNFTPKTIFKLLKPFEPIIENTPMLRTLCTVNIWGLIADDKFPSSGYRN